MSRKSILKNLCELIGSYPNAVATLAFLALSAFAIYLAKQAFIEHPQEFFIYGIVVLAALSVSFIVYFMFLLRSRSGRLS